MAPRLWLELDLLLEHATELEARECGVSLRRSTVSDAVSKLPPNSCHPTSTKPMGDHSSVGPPILPRANPDNLRAPSTATAASGRPAFLLTLEPASRALVSLLLPPPPPPRMPFTPQGITASTSRVSTTRRAHILSIRWSL